MPLMQGGAFCLSRRGRHINLRLAHLLDGKDVVNDYRLAFDFGRIVALVRDSHELIAQTESKCHLSRGRQKRDNPCSIHNFCYAGGGAPEKPTFGIKTLTLWQEIAKP